MNSLFLRVKHFEKLLTESVCIIILKERLLNLQRLDNTYSLKISNNEIDFRECQFIKKQNIEFSYYNKSNKGGDSNE